MSISRRSLLGLARAEPAKPYAKISQSCFAYFQIACESCAEACDHGAIAFSRKGFVKQPIVITDRCTGCGACTSVCPASAISLHPGTGDS